MHPVKFDSPEHQIRKHPKPWRRFSFEPTGWDTCMDGFSGLQDQSTKSKPIRRRSSTTLSSRATAHIDPEEKSQESLFDIDWDSDNENKGNDINTHPSSQAFTQETDKSSVVLIDTPESPEFSQKQSTRTTKIFNKTKHSKHKSRNGTPKPHFSAKRKHGYVDRNNDIDCASPINKRTNVQAQEISDYGSDNEPFSSELLPTSRESQPSPSPSINTPADSPNPSTPSQSRVGASEWMKGLKWQPGTPTRGGEEREDLLEAVESGKKNKKYIGGGLAEKLNRLILREKSDLTFWSHKIHKSLDQTDNTKSLTVKIESCTKTNSTYICKCSLVGGVPYTIQLNSNSLTVVFNQSNVIKIGDTWKICPPWQTMKLNTGETVLLCTQHSVMVSQSAHCKSPYAKGDEYTRLVLAQWRCPCSSENNKLPTPRCPAVLNPCITEDVPIMKEESQDSEVTSECHLNVTTMSQSTSQVNKPRDSILERIEKQGGSGKVSFTATILRICCHSSPKNRLSLGTSPSPQSSLHKESPFRRRLTWAPNSSKSSPQRSPNKATPKWSLLVQDKNGGLCEVKVDDGTSLEWEEVLQNGEGSVVVFSRLRVTQRTNKARSPGLFSMIESLWTADGVEFEDESQQETQESIDNKTSTRAPPTFCYVLSTVPGESNYEIVQKHSTIYRDTTLVPSLSDATSGRISFIAFLENNETSVQENHKPIHRLQATMLNPESKSKVEGQFTMIIRETAFVADEIVRSFHGKTVFMCKDILKSGDNLFVDGYSRVLPGHYRT